MKYFLFLALILVATTSFSKNSYAQFKVKDSFYFMKDDEEFSDEEKDEEAQYIHDQCVNNSIQSVYFDCACVAGAFRAERDKEKIMPQSQIVNTILTSDVYGCANTAAIAGETYEFCSEYARVFRSRKKNNSQYCKCVANTMAHNFKKEPQLRRRHIKDLRVNAMGSCRYKYD